MAEAAAAQNDAGCDAGIHKTDATIVFQPSFALFSAQRARARTLFQTCMNCDADALVRANERLLIIVVVDSFSDADAFKWKDIP